MARHACFKQTTQSVDAARHGGARLTQIMLALLWLLGAHSSFAAGSLLIWPLDPTIEAGQRSAAIWLENVGTQALTLQIRVYAWSQADYRDAYAAQDQLVGTPPFSTITPGKKQLVRLTLTQPVAAGQEQAFRILIDELPAAITDGAVARAGAGLRFQMRYSLPLFAYGSGLWGKLPHATARATAQATPQLDWALGESDGEHYLELRNSGNAHARLSQVQLLSSSSSSSSGSGSTSDAALDTELSSGLLGYVLPGSIMRWPLRPDQTLSVQRLQVRLGQATESTFIVPR